MTMLEFAQHLIMICNRHNGSVISWGRSVRHNKEVGGHPLSLHVSWLAGDIVFDTPEDSEEAAKLAKRVGLFWKRNGSKTLHIQGLKKAKAI